MNTLKCQHSFIATRRIIFITKLHLESFNYAMTQGLFLIISGLSSYFLDFIFSKYKIVIQITGLYVSKPYSLKKEIKYKVIPRQCKETKSSYKGDFLSIFHINHRKERKNFLIRIGKIPIMVKSLKCNLFNANSRQMVEIDEENLEMGGYFIVNGAEKIIRPLLVPKRNFIHVVSRIANLKKHKLYTSLSCSFRSVDKIQNSKTFHLHYLISGNIHVRIVFKKHEFFIPIVILLKSLIDISDKKLIDIFGYFDLGNKYTRQRILTMIREAYSYCNISKRKEVLNFMGKILKTAFDFDFLTNSEISEVFLSKYLFIHLGSEYKSKFDLLLLMVQKLLYAYKGNYSENNYDSIESQELLLPGHLYLIYLRERFENSIYNYFLNKIKKENKYTLKYLKNSFNLVTIDIEKLVSSGNICFNFKEELIQLSGLSVSVERLNFGRFLSYFRNIHKGNFLLQSKKNTSRKIFPHSWGYICPVHTSDGLLCGISNYLSFSVIFNSSNSIEKKKFKKYLIRNGFDEIEHTQKPFIPILLDGKLLGFCENLKLEWIIDKIRCEKISRLGIIPKSMEILYNRRIFTKGFFSSCSFLSEENRLLRPVLCNNYVHTKNFFFSKKANQFNFQTEKELELIGPNEQFLLNIQFLENENKENRKKFFWTHLEIDSSIILSLVAALTPFSDLNQSPRNTYQCQMFKQSIGVPFYTFWRRNDTKNYFLLIPQIPVCRNKLIQDGMYLDAFPIGVNAVVAVLCYTSFDMEDAMVINNFSIDRGFFSSKVTTTSNFEMKKFSYKKEFEQIIPVSPGKHISRGEVIFFSQIKGKTQKNQRISVYYDSYEKSVIECLKLTLKKEKINCTIKLRARRKPNTGDKFASRHGQKGVFSMNCPCIDMPFSEIGIVPDIIFNPHGFPSRMTIGVIVESLAGKVSCLNGFFYDSSPFCLNKKHLETYCFGEKLRESGFKFYGNEIFYSGYTGEPLKIEVYNGIIHYQRLKHMVNDKFQVSEISPRNSITRQPIKGKKFGGSIRFGEMERDVLLGHGSTFLLHDRLQLSSDLHSIKINMKTCDMFSLKPVYKKIHDRTFFSNKNAFLPYASKFLATELLVLNIKFNLVPSDG
ncbi:DNA-directed RNA polymerase I 135K chain (nucleomorph) [Cryptomonas paramecium]|uniref:DNA-directed RNA polymerase subunit beta n=1 Tax=Cryptomonas paramaecium TaxID=2898 RepID=F2HHE3_9CRYP|nr:DNA-directed RNA polymerase I 135K chain [Cryptomonas paramecium]AEA38739.1 DNA-directed RNA polymerase I 135K chain [Cryptomonas paramecium]|mmetsp:Transcript_36895/g.98049  ORF Transcript_36895/g.98049 Transcript_36895/m.98049 type:complete len:1103 (+) Transcript_36895:5382-8690(+)